MSERSPLDLHEIGHLQEIAVREGVHLEPLASRHAVSLLAVLNKDVSIRHRVSVAARLHSVTDVEAEIQAIAKDPSLLRYVIAVDSKVVGMVSFWRDEGFFGQPPEPNGYGFGFFLDPDWRGKGLIGSAVRMLMQEARTVLDVDCFLAFCEDDNMASIAVIKGLGFVATDERYGEPVTGWQERKYKLVIPSV